MAKLSYSDDALNVKHLFYRKDSMLYVEGPDDRLFWHFIFHHFKTENVEVEDVGGGEEIDKIITKIHSGDLSCYAARDSDYKALHGELIKNNNVFYTYGYSIENSLYVEDIIFEIIRLKSKSTYTDKQPVRNWLGASLKAIENLIHIDYANYKFDYSLEVLGDSCYKFLIDHNSEQFDDAKIETHSEILMQTINPDAINEAKKIIDDSHYSLSDLVSGHFFASLVQKFVKATLKSLGVTRNIYTDDLYILSISSFEKMFTNHPHYAHYRSQILNI